MPAIRIVPRHEELRGRPDEIWTHEMFGSADYPIIHQKIRHRWTAIVDVDRIVVVRPVVLFQYFVNALESLTLTSQHCHFGFGQQLAHHEESKRLEEVALIFSADSPVLD